MDKTCSVLVDGKPCGRPVNARSMCITHYQRWRKTGTTDAPPEKPRACGHERTPENTLVDKNGKKRCRPCREAYKAAFVPAGQCTVKDCGRPAIANGLCGRDYQRMAIKGNTDDPVRLTPEQRYQNQLAASNRWNAANRERIRQQQRAKYWGDVEPPAPRQHRPRRASGEPKPAPRLKRPKLTPEEYRARERERARRYRAANQEKVSAYNKRWTLENPGKRTELARKWVAANPDKARENWTAKRVRRLQQMRSTAVGKVSYKAILAEFGMVCHLCGNEIESRKDLHYDHVIPLSRGGTHTQDNIRPAHRHCNQLKSAKLMSELGDIAS